MHPDKFGDSYDLVKRFWQEMFTAWGAPLYANPTHFSAVSNEKSKEFLTHYTKLTNIKILEVREEQWITPPRDRYSLFNDPDTGIHLVDSENKNEGRKHIRLATIKKQFEKDKKIAAILTYDQGHNRLHERTSGNRKLQLIEKKNELNKKYSAFYYDSHAPFLFVFRRPEDADSFKAIVREKGFPVKNRLDHI